MMRASLLAAVPTRQLSCLRGFGLAALRRGINLQRPTALGRVQQQAPRVVASSSSSPGQPDSRHGRQQWQLVYSQVLAFQQAHGRLPGTDASKAGPLLEGERELGMWCAQQQRRKDGSQGSPLSAEEKAALQAIPGWEWVRVRPTRKDWWQWLREVEAFVAQHERLPRRHISKSQPLLLGEKQLGKWCHNQRTRYKGQQQPPLSHEQEAALAAIPGWFWGQWQQQDWEQPYQQVAAFQQQHGRLPRQEGSSSQPLVENEGQLGNWCIRQRGRYKGQQQPPLSAEQEAALADIPGWYWEQYRQQDWEHQRQQVAAFQQQHGRLPRMEGSSSQPLTHNEQQLGNWCFTQRKSYKGQRQPPLSHEQEAALAAIPGWFWGQWQHQDWEQQCQQVAAFQQQHGRLPRQGGSGSQPLEENEQQLGLWCGRQRRRYKGAEQPPLSTEQQAALEAVPGWFWEQRPPWEKQYQRVVAFWQEHSRLPRQTGTTSKPFAAGEQELGLWCSRQRQRMRGSNPRQGPLTPSQVAALESIEGWWWNIRT